MYFSTIKKYRCKDRHLCTINFKLAMCKWHIWMYFAKTNKCQSAKTILAREHNLHLFKTCYKITLNRWCIICFEPKVHCFALRFRNLKARKWYLNWNNNCDCFVRMPIISSFKLFFFLNNVTFEIKFGVATLLFKSIILVKMPPHLSTRFSFLFFSYLVQ